jgi:hypothetical protein
VDLKQVRQLLGWQVSAYNRRIWRGIIPLISLQPGKIVLFTSNALAGHALPASFFFLMLLEKYGLQLHHLTSHAISLVAIFIHHCEMYVGVRSSVHLFWLFFTPWAFERRANNLGAYYFQHRGKSSSIYITPQL